MSVAICTCPLQHVPGTAGVSGRDAHAQSHLPATRRVVALEACSKHEPRTPEINDSSHASACVELTLACRELLELPDLTSFSQLQSLNISFNSISVLPSLEHVVSLLSLNVSHNLLTDLPSLPPSLTTLNAASNKLSTTSHLTSLSQVTELWIGHNDITSLPALLCGLMDMNSLSCLILCESPVCKVYDPAVFMHSIVHAVPSLTRLCMFAPALGRRAPGVGLSQYTGLLPVSAATVEQAFKFTNSKAGRDFALEISKEAALATAVVVSHKGHAPTVTVAPAPIPGTRAGKVASGTMHSAGGGGVGAISRSGIRGIQSLSAGSDYPESDVHAEGAEASDAKPPVPAPVPAPMSLSAAVAGLPDLSSMVLGSGATTGTASAGGISVGRSRRVSGTTRTRVSSRVRVRVPGVDTSAAVGSASISVTLGAASSHPATTATSHSAKEASRAVGQVRYTVQYGSGPGQGRTAVDIRPDGSAAFVWPAGRVGVSVEVDEGATLEYSTATTASATAATAPAGSVAAASVAAHVSLYRITAFAKDSGKTAAPVVTMDGFGSGVIATSKGATVLSSLDDGTGSVLDSRGVVLHRWDEHGSLLPAPTGTLTGLGDTLHSRSGPSLSATRSSASVAGSTRTATGAGAGSAVDEGVFDSAAGTFRIGYGGTLGVLYHVKSRAMQVFAKVDNVHHCVVQGFNVAAAGIPAGCDLFGAPLPPTAPLAPAGPAPSHTDRLSDIRAAVAKLG